MRRTRTRILINAMIAAGHRPRCPRALRIRAFAFGQLTGRG